MENNVESVLMNPIFDNEKVNKINNFTGNDMTVDTYFFKKGQVLDYHRHPKGDQTFFFIKGQGKFYLNNGSESVIDVVEGSIVYVPKDIWHKVENTGDTLIACQATVAGAGMENKG